MSSSLLPRKYHDSFLLHSKQRGCSQFLLWKVSLVGGLNQAEPEASLFLPGSLPSEEWGPLRPSEHQLWRSVWNVYPSLGFHLLHLSSPRLLLCVLAGHGFSTFAVHPLKVLNQSIEFSCARTGRSDWNKCANIKVHLLLFWNHIYHKG